MLAMKAPENVRQSLSPAEEEFVRRAEELAERLRPILEHMA